LIRSNRREPKKVHSGESLKSAAKPAEIAVWEACHPGHVGINSPLLWLKTRSSHDEIVGAAMQEIADWLEKLGMSQYAQRFAENDIDVRALRYLTDQDLKDIGVSLGHRRRMLAAIAEQRAEKDLHPPLSLQTSFQGNAQTRNRHRVGMPPGSC
jgi:uncharacterized protein YjiS (DUF1127 family)